MSDEATENARLASWLLLVGAGLALIGNLTHPFVDVDAGIEALLHEATGGMWLPIHLVLVVATVLFAAGLASFSRVISHPVGAAYARASAALAVIGGTMLGAALGALDGYGMATIAADWREATGAEQELLASQANVLGVLDGGLIAMGVLIFFGLALLGFSAALLVSEIMPRWLGLAGAAVAVFGVITGVAMTVTGLTELTVNLMFRPLGALATVFAIVLGLKLRTLAAASSVTRQPVVSD